MTSVKNPHQLTIQLVKTQVNPTRRGLGYFSQNPTQPTSFRRVSKTRTFNNSAIIHDISSLIHHISSLIHYISFLIHYISHSSHLISHSSHIIFHSSHLIVAMMLALSFEDRTFDDLKDLLLYLNQHADSEDYAIVLKRTKKFKLQVTCKT